MDKIEYLGNTKIQHGKLNDRVYLMAFNERDYPRIIDEIISLAEKNDYGKIFAKVPSDYSRGFKEKGFEEEARIEDYARKGTLSFLSRFNKPERRLSNCAKNREVLDCSIEKGTEGIKPLDPDYLIKKAPEEDLPEIAELYGKVFTSYPFPINDAAYLKKTLDGTEYYAAYHQGKVVAASSCEKNVKDKAAELTDFATDPIHKGKNFAYRLIRMMLTDMEEQGYLSAYTICRAKEPSINIPFARSGFTYSGTLKQNTQIMGTYEDMNVWHRRITFT